MDLLNPKRSRRKPRQCEICNSMYVPTYGAQRACSRTCGVILRGQTPGGSPKICAHDLNEPLTRERAWLKQQRRLRYRRYMRTYIRDRYRNNPAVREQMKANARRRSAQLRGSIGRADSLNLEQIAQRDSHRCHICQNFVKASERSLDHLIPVSKGGEHIQSNVALAHRSCNSRRGAGCLPAQLRMEVFSA